MSSIKEEIADLRCTSSDLQLINNWCCHIFDSIKLLRRENYDGVIQLSKQLLTLYGPRHCIYQLQCLALRGLHQDEEAALSLSLARETGSVCLPLSNRARELGNEAFSAGHMDKAHRYYVIGQSYNLCDMRLPLNLAAVLMRKGDYVYASEVSELAFEIGLAFGAPESLLKTAFARRVASLKELPSCSCLRVWASSARRQMARCSKTNPNAGQGFYEEIMVGTTTPGERSEIEHHLAICWTKRPANYAMVVSHYTAAIGLSPNTSSLYADRAICHLRLGLFADGLADADSAVRLTMATGPDANAHWLKGMCLHALGRFECARKAFATAVEIDPISNTPYALSLRMLSGPGPNMMLFGALIDKLQLSVPKSTR